MNVDVLTNFVRESLHQPLFSLYYPSCSERFERFQLLLLWHTEPRRPNEQDDDQPDTPPLWLNPVEPDVAPVQGTSNECVPTIG